MCLGVPGRVVSFHDGTDQLATVDITGVTRNVNVGLVREDGLAVGDWVLVHVGFAMSIIDEDEAAFALDSLKMLEGQWQDEVDDIAGSRID